MSKRNFILLIIILVIVTTITLFYFYSNKQESSLPSSSGTNFLSEFFPFTDNTKKPPTDTENPIDISGYVPPTTEVVSVNKLKKVSNLPIAGYGVFMKEKFKDVSIVPVPPVIENPVEVTTKTVTKKPTPPQTEFVPALRYIEKATGNVYQTFADKIDERKITTTIIPQIYEASFGNKGESVIIRYLKEDTKTIETFVGSLPKEMLGGDTSEKSEITGSFLPENITDLSVSSDTLKIFYLFNLNNNAVGVMSDPLGAKKVQIFNHSFTEWLSAYPNNKIITLTTKPASSVGGYMYAIDPNRKDLVKVLSNINGLTTLTSPNSKLVLFADNTLSLKIFNTETKEYIQTGVKTMPEKCTWNTQNTVIYCAVPKTLENISYPESWYQGEVSFKDKIWKIDATNGSPTLLADLISISQGEEIDGIKLALDENENFLFFINKENSNLWELGLK